MKKVNYLLSVLVLVLLAYNFSLSQDGKIYDIAPINQTAQPDTTPPVGFPYPTLFNFYYATIGAPAINAGTVGAMYFQDKFYLNRWNSTTLYRYNGGWSGVTTFFDSLVYQGSIRDLATDGTFLYGGSATATVYKMNALGISQGTITLGGSAVARALAYSPDENAFFASNFSDDIRVCNATTGALIRTLTGTASLAGKYGMAYSNVLGDVPALWVWGQGTVADPYNKLYKVNPQTGATIATYAFGPLPVPPGATSPSGIAGGAEVCLIGGKLVLLLNYQNYALTGHVLGNVVPVELTSFVAKVGNGQVELNWTTATELNNKGFEIQRSTSDNQFVSVGFINGNGTSTQTHSYSFIDKNNVPGQYSYRLKQVDFDGGYEYSKIVEVEISTPTEFALNQNYPNPFNPSTSITFSVAVDSKVDVKLFNVLGQQVATIFSSNVAAGLQTINFDASQLNSGVYFYQMDAKGIDGSSFTSIKKMMLTK